MRSVLLGLFFFAATAVAQSPGTGDAPRGSTPPGTSQDGSRPADGAITGGATAKEKIARCEQLSGTLREECLRKQRDEASDKQ